MKEKQIHREERLLLELNEKKNITYTNKKSRRIIGYEKEEFKNINYKDMFHKDYPETFFDEIFNKIDEGMSLTGILKIKINKNEYIWTEVDIYSSKNKKDEQIYIIKKKGTSENKEDLQMLLLSDYNKYKS